MTPEQVTLAALALTAAAAHAEPAAAPAGATQFCLRNPSFCEAHAAAIAPLSAMETIQRINREVNFQVLPQAYSTDAEKRAENGNWRVVMPSGLGGCVEYAQTKRLLLAWAGVPLGAMRVAQVKSPRGGAGDFHAVLLVTVPGSVLVLDNLTPAIWPVDQANYEFVALQDGWKWVTP